MLMLLCGNKHKLTNLATHFKVYKLKSQYVRIFVEIMQKELLKLLTQCEQIKVLMLSALCIVVQRYLMKLAC